ncbi:MAG: translation initiation factor IF-2 [Candidatus Aquicultor secundus]|uniref:Translation initiation factor IF-2 n=1 Tax=Candidatus Aquicultor secundus TaxID=1973895 RepID=A0A2M7T6S2_9ACTN|nr:translation initiation factor IF-2 [Candidatus Aquicultor secundus]NCO65570.1 translation initiation factor IF-2 [Solirubrobacter sp.]OIO88949.1 MAG: translation initiation factor IF-2 [Candidatus Aquicultor secundus]PIU26175.1 MAG: translation initiation factor IF-2 [Candidatus Aquicultor secundus]PIW22803.1 MAG: translation initiation factor IF-2 [Candidatus Aquicultor secundus]PIX51441.1 MAG: translation initiation factor IF-2 [Candidatus Aquicultor secundus]
MRVYELAKQMGISSAELMDKLKTIGIEVKSHAASIDPEVVRKLDGAPKASSSPRAAVQDKETVAKKTATTKPAKASAKAASEKAPVAAQTKAAPQVKAAETPRAPQAERPSQPAQPAKTGVKAQGGANVQADTKPKPGAKTPQTQRRPGTRPAAPQKQSGRPQVTVEEPKRVIEVPLAATVKEFASLVGKEPNELIKMLLKLGELVTISQSLSSEAIEILADEMELNVKFYNPEEVHVEEEIVEDSDSLLPRPPVVTVMGHVDHGKTSLLDALRKTDVTSGEAGGITQHIGAYQVVLGGRKITFIDTPGHEAFTAMRARGANVTDIVVLVVAADDGVMPQTVEAINHAKAAGVPIVVAVNKIDKPNADPTRVRQELTKYELIPEEWGGETIFVDVSAKKQINLGDLLEMILLVADVQELKANPKATARGITIEAKLDRGRGPIATVLINRGTLRVGDAVIAGTAYGKVRAMNDDKGHPVREATPAQPVEVIGLSSLPRGGEELKVVEDEKTARRIAEKRALKRRLIAQEQRRRITLEDLFSRIQEGEVKDLNLVIKADTQGSVEALKDALYKLNTSEVQIQVIHTGVGGISETDIMLAAASNAIVIGFNVRPDINATAMATKESVDIRTYRIIYKVVEDITSALSGLLSPAIDEVDTGRAEVRALFKVPKLGVIAGCYVTNGEIDRNDRVRLVREGQVVYDGGIISLRRFKDDVKTVREGFECGIGLENFQDVKEGDVIETYKLVERERQLGE